MVVINVSLTKETVKEMEPFIDGAIIRSRSHLIEKALIEYMDKEVKK